MLRAKPIARAKKVFAKAKIAKQRIKAAVVLKKHLLENRRFINYFSSFNARDFTAQKMFDSMELLLKKYFPSAKERQEAIVQKKIIDTYKFWMHPPIRTAIEAMISNVAFKELGFSPKELSGLLRAHARAEYSPKAIDDFCLKQAIKKRALVEEEKRLLERDVKAALERAKLLAKSVRELRNRMYLREFVQVNAADGFSHIIAIHMAGLEAILANPN